MPFSVELIIHEYEKHLNAVGPNQVFFWNILAIDDGVVMICLVKMHTMLQYPHQDAKAFLLTVNKYIH